MELTYFSSFVKQYLGAPVASALSAADAEIEELKNKNEELQRQLDELRGTREGGEEN